MATTLDSKGCEYGRITRIKIDNLENTTKEILVGIKDIQAKNIDMFNHFTERYEAMQKDAMNKFPPWLTAIMTLGGTLLGALVVWALTHRVN